MKNLNFGSMRSRMQIYFLLLLSLVACVDKIDVDINRSPSIVIDGLITTKPGPYQVKISTFDVVTNQSIGVEGARVVIRDDADNVAQLEDLSYGNYQTVESEIRGEIGRSYILEVTLEDGSHYVSEAELIRPNVGIETIYFEEGATTEVTEQGNIIERDNVSVYIDSKSPEGNDNLYRWRYKTTYEFVTRPELRTRPNPERPLDEIPDPPPCSGYVANANGLVQVSECECCVCYVTNYSNEAIVSDDRFIKGAFRALKMETFLLDDRFRQQFYIEVEQLSISEEAHEFWDLIAKQNDNSSIFSIPPAKVPSNISSVHNPSEVVLGYFGASDSKTISLSIKRREILGRIPTEPVFNEDCRFRGNSSIEKPEFW